MFPPRVNWASKFRPKLSFSNAFRAATDNPPIGPEVGSCGAAAFRREPVLSREVAADPRWAGYVEVAHEAGVRACWSTPVFSSTGAWACVQ